MWYISESLSNSSNRNPESWLRLIIRSDLIWIDWRDIALVVPSGLSAPRIKQLREVTSICPFVALAATTKGLTTLVPSVQMPGTLLPALNSDFLPFDQFAKKLESEQTWDPHLPAWRSLEVRQLEQSFHRHWIYCPWSKESAKWDRQLSICCIWHCQVLAKSRWLMRHGHSV